LFAIQAICYPQFGDESERVIEGGTDAAGNNSDNAGEQDLFKENNWQTITLI